MIIFDAQLEDKRANPLEVVRADEIYAARAISQHERDVKRERTNERTNARTTTKFSRAMIFISQLERIVLVVRLSPGCC